MAISDGLEPQPVEWPLTRSDNQNASVQQQPSYRVIESEWKWFGNVVFPS